MKTKICLTDDHKIVYEGISSFLLGNEEFELVNHSESGKDLLKNLKTNNPDILLLDIKMPGLSGIQLAKIISKDYPNIKIVFLTSNDDEGSLNEAVKAGGLGYLLKDISEEEFLTAMKKIKSGEKYFSKGIQNALFNNYTKTITENDEFHDNIITQREVEIIKHIAEGCSYKEIGERLFISKRTVETHKKNIMEKLGFSNTVEIVKYAILNGITDL